MVKLSRNFDFAPEIPQKNQKKYHNSLRKKDLQIFRIISSEWVLSMVEIWRNVNFLTKFLTWHPLDHLPWNDPIVSSAKVNLLYLMYSTAQMCCLLHLIKQHCLLKTLKNSDLDDLGMSLPVFPSRTNLKLHKISITA